MKKKHIVIIPRPDGKASCSKCRHLKTSKTGILRCDLTGHTPIAACDKFRDASVGHPNIQGGVSGVYYL